METHQISGESDESPSSEKSSSDEGSSGMEQMEQESDKGAKKRKAGLKLDQIAARLQEKNSPENPDCSDGVNDSNYEVKLSLVKIILSYSIHPKILLIVLF